MRTINRIIVHCTGTSVKATPEQIKNYHLSLGWKDCGYHYLIDAEGNLHNMRPVEMVGAHTLHQNLDSIGIALIGGKDGKFDFTFQQLNTLVSLCKNLCDIYLITLDNVKGHNDYTQEKTCPNFNVKNLFKYETL